MNRTDAGGANRPQSSNTQVVKGEVVAIGFRNRETGYSILTVKMASGTRVKVVGSTSAEIGECVSAQGEWKVHPKFGHQFVAVVVNVAKPESPDAIARYLASGNIKGIGPTLATKIVATFGVDTFRVFEEEPERLAELRGIGQKKLAEILGHWRESEGNRQLLVSLAAYGIVGAVAERILRRYGEAAAQVVKSDPYRLAREVKGVGFLTADAIALGNGERVDSTGRIDAGLNHLIGTAIGSGHCGVLEGTFLASAVELLKVDSAVIRPVLAEAYRSRSYLVRVQLPDEKTYVFEKRLFAEEKWIAEEIARRRALAPVWSLTIEQAAEIADRAQKNAGVSLTDEQNSAVIMALTLRVGIVTGGPGTGKTSTLRVVLEAYRQVRALVAMAAPTGKAAKRMRESTGLDALTIARLIGMGTENEGVTMVEGDVLVIDEASMLDVRQMASVLRALDDDCSLLLVGDMDQLPSVGAGSVLRDMIESEFVPKVRLTKIFRQAATSAIIRNAHRINHGQDIEADLGPDTDFHFVVADQPDAIAAKVKELVSTSIPSHLGIAPEEVQVLSLMRKTRTGTETLNQDLQAVLNPAPSEHVERFGKRYGVGDRVLQTVNNYSLNVMNGESGVVRAVRRDTNVVVVEVEGKAIEYPFADLDQLDLAYAMTVHKSQGSQFSAVVVPVSTQHYMMLQRSIIYTAVTRATRLCVLVGQRQALSQAIQNRRTERRITTLGGRLRRLAQVGLPPVE